MSNTQPPPADTTRHSAAALDKGFQSINSSLLTVTVTTNRRKPSGSRSGLNKPQSQPMQDLVPVIPAEAQERSTFRPRSANDNMWVDLRDREEAIRDAVQAFEWPKAQVLLDMLADFLKVAERYIQNKEIDKADVVATHCELLARWPHNSRRRHTYEDWMVLADTAECIGMGDKIEQRRLQHLSQALQLLARIHVLQGRYRDAMAALEDLLDRCLLKGAGEPRQFDQLVDVMSNTLDAARQQEGEAADAFPMDFQYSFSSVLERRFTSKLRSLLTLCEGNVDSVTERQRLQRKASQAASWLHRTRLLLVDSLRQRLENQLRILQARQSSPGASGGSSRGGLTAAQRSYLLTRDHCRFLAAAITLLLSSTSAMSIQHACTNEEHQETINMIQRWFDWVLENPALSLALPEKDNMDEWGQLVQQSAFIAENTSASLDGPDESYRGHYVASYPALDRVSSTFPHSFGLTLLRAAAPGAPSLGAAQVWPLCTTLDTALFHLGHSSRPKVRAASQQREIPPYVEEMPDEEAAYRDQAMRAASERASSRRSPPDRFCGTPQSQLKCGVLCSPREVIDTSPTSTNRQTSRHTEGGESASERRRRRGGSSGRRDEFDGESTICLSSASTSPSRTARGRSSRTPQMKKRTCVVEDVMESPEQSNTERPKSAERSRRPVFHDWCCCQRTSAVENRPLNVRPVNNQGSPRALLMPLRKMPSPPKTRPPSSGLPSLRADSIEGSLRAASFDLANDPRRVNEILAKCAPPRRFGSSATSSVTGRTHSFRGSIPVPDSMTNESKPQQRRPSISRSSLCHGDDMVLESDNAAPVREPYNVYDPMRRSRERHTSPGKDSRRTANPDQKKQGQRRDLCDALINGEHRLAYLRDPARHPNDVDPRSALPTPKEAYLFR